jgi:hypothetical protein
LVNAVHMVDISYLQPSLRISISINWCTSILFDILSIILFGFFFLSCLWTYSLIYTVHH